MINPFEITNKKILVVGCASKTGQVVFQKLSNHGAQVIGIYGQNEVIDGECCKEKLFQLDFTDLQSINSSLKNILENYTPIDGIVFLYGIGGVRPLSMTKPDFVSSMFDLNVSLFIEVVRSLCRKGVLNNGASIVALSSVSSIRGLKSKVAYSASKAALDSAVRVMAAELGDRRIRVNSIQKGWVEEDMTLDFIQDNMSLNNNQDFKRQLLGVISSDDIANSIIFLLSDASKSITGTNLLLDGGYTL